MIKKKICFITSSRADYGLLSNLISLFKKDNSLETFLITTGSHLSKNYGNTINEIDKNFLKKNYQINIFKKVKNLGHINKILSNTILKFNKILSKSKPDLIFVLGDRYEIFGVSISAFILNIPLAHIHGGEKTQGSFDDAFRHCITKLSNLHFCTTLEYKKRISQLGENPKYIFNVGSLGVDNINKIKFKTKKYLEKKYNLIKNKKIVMISIHPETYGNVNNISLINELLISIRILNDFNLIFTSSNADNDGYKFNEILKRFSKENKNCFYISSFGHVNYLSMLKCADLLIGNSSSGIIEAPSLNTPSINIGNRQKGRLKAKSVIDSKANSKNITKYINIALSDKFKKNKKIFKNPYKKRNTIEKIYKIIKSNINYNYNKSFLDL